MCLVHAMLELGRQLSQMHTRDDHMPGIALALPLALCDRTWNSPNLSWKLAVDSREFYTESIADLGALNSGTTHNL